MALTCVFMDSWDHYDGITPKWTTGGNDCEIDLTGTKSRTGRGCLVIRSGAFGPSKVITATANPLVVTAFHPGGSVPSGTSANITYMTDSSSGVQNVRTVYNGDLSVSVLNGNDPFGLVLGTSGAGVIDASNYNEIVTKAFIATAAGGGSVEVWVNGVQVLNLTNVRTKHPSAAATVDTIQLLCNGGQTNGRHDDTMIYTWSAPSDEITTAPLIYYYVAGSDSAPLQWTPSTGLTHFNLVDDVPQQAVTNVSDSTVGHVDQYLQVLAVDENVPPVPANVTILAAQTVMYCGLDNAGVHSIADNIDGSTGTSNPLTTGQTFITSVHMINPATGTDWQLSDFTTTPMGPEVTV